MQTVMLKVHKISFFSKVIVFLPFAYFYVKWCQGKIKFKETTKTKTHSFDDQSYKNEI